MLRFLICLHSRTQHCLSIPCAPLQDQAVGLEAFCVPRRHPGGVAHPRRAPRGGHAKFVEHGRLEEGKAALKMIHGADDVEPEFSAILEASRIAHGVKHPFRNLLSRRNCPPARCRRPLAGVPAANGDQRDAVLRAGAVHDVCKFA
ncbi:unnamed protein product [Urochloa humidicola]